MVVLKIMMMHFRTASFNDIIPLPIKKHNNSVEVDSSTDDDDDDGNSEADWPSSRSPGSSRVSFALLHGLYSGLVTRCV